MTIVTMPWCVLGSGSRDLRREHYPLIKSALEKFMEPRGAVFIHGDGPGRNGSVGFDTLAAHAAEALGYRVYAFPADWDRFGKFAGPMRNALMTEILFAHHAARSRLALVAFPTGGPGTAGTLALVTRESKKRDIAVLIEQFPVTL